MLGHCKLRESCTQKLQFCVTGKQFMFIPSLHDLVHEGKPARSYFLLPKCDVSSVEPEEERTAASEGLACGATELM